MFPELEIANGGTYAFIITLSNQIKIYNVKPIHGRMFIIPDLGLFQLDEKYRYTFKKSEIYFFNQKSCNPLNLDAIREVREHLARQHANHLSVEDLSHYVYKIKFGDLVKKKKNAIYNELQAEGQVTKRDLLNAVFDGTLDETARAIVDMDLKASNQPLIVANGSGFSDTTIEWLNDYYKEDVVGRYSTLGRTLMEQRFRLKPSLQVFGFLPMNRTFRKQNLGLIIVNNRVIELDPYIKVSTDPNTGVLNIETKEYGTFKVQETKTRYRHGKSNIYFMSVTTRPRINSIPTPASDNDNELEVPSNWAS